MLETIHVANKEIRFFKKIYNQEQVIMAHVRLFKSTFFVVDNFLSPQALYSRG